MCHSECRAKAFEGHIREHNRLVDQECLNKADLDKLFTNGSCDDALTAVIKAVKSRKDFDSSFYDGSTRG